MRPGWSRRATWPGTMLRGEVQVKILALLASGIALLLSSTGCHLVGGADAAPGPDARATVDGPVPPAGLAFESNLGQDDPWVRFVARGNGFALRLEDTGAALRLPDGDVLLSIAGMHRAGCVAARSSVADHPVG